MPVVAVDYDQLVEVIGRRLPKEELVARVPMMGGAYDGEKDGRLLFEFFPNRPDLLSIEGLGRACRAFFDVEPGLKRYPVEPSDDTVTIDASVRRVRPFIGFARVDGLRIDEAYLVELIDLQERLTTGPGRRRKKVAVGIHDAAPVRGPFLYQAVPLDAHAFVPLQMDRPFTPRQILEEHEKGRLFRHLVEPHGRAALITDRDGQVLSMPPVINGQLTALTTRTRDVLIDVTGTEERATMGILNIVATSLAERGGRIRTLKVVSGRTGHDRTTPDLTPQGTTLPYARVTTLLGLRPTAEEVRTYLGRMGHEATPASKQSALVHSPAWRLDLLHPDDLVEDVGIGYGFDRFSPRLPHVAHFGRLLPSTRRAERARTALLGLGFTEVVTLTITSQADALERVGAPSRQLVQVSNPVTLDQSVLRPHLYTSLLALLRANKHRELPQAIFEVGYAAPPRDGEPPRNELRAAALRIAPRATFSECKGVVEAFLRDVGIVAEIAPGATPGFIEGRCALLRHDGHDTGFFGELHPATVATFELGAPVYGLEVGLAGRPSGAGAPEA